MPLGIDRPMSPGPRPGARHPMHGNHRAAGPGPPMGGSRTSWGPWGPTRSVQRVADWVGKDGKAYIGLLVAYKALISGL